MFTKVAAAGALGTAIRLIGMLPLTVAIYGNPLTYLVLNTFGCALAGVVIGKLGATELRQVVSHGLLGAFTTFSGVIVAAGRIGHNLGLVAEDSSAMSATGLLLAFGYIAVSIGFGLSVFIAAKRMATR